MSSTLKLFGNSWYKYWDLSSYFISIFVLKSLHLLLGFSWLELGSWSPEGEADEENGTKFVETIRIRINATTNTAMLAFTGVVHHIGV